MLKLRTRVGDAAPLSIVELVGSGEGGAKVAKGGKPAKAPKATAAKAEAKGGRAPRKKASAE